MKTGANTGVSPVTLDDAVARARLLDPTAFDWLVDQYSARLFGLMHRLTARASDAEDLVQEVFLRLVRVMPTYRHEGRFEAWLFRIAANVAREHLRRGRVRAGGNSRIASPSDPDSESASAWADLSTAQPDEPLTVAEDADEVQRSLARLPAPEREVIMLRHYGELSYQEIADAMGTPLGTALARAHRAHKKLREWMEPS